MLRYGGVYGLPSTYRYMILEYSDSSDGGQTPNGVCVHSIEDVTVLFTATSDTGRLPRSCGLKKVDEIYFDETVVVCYFTLLGGMAKNLGTRLDL